MDEDLGVPSKMPKTIPTLIAIWAAFEALRWWVGNEGENPQGLTFAVAEALSFVYIFLIVALVGVGLIGRSRVVWFLAFLWLGLQAGFGVINLALNSYPLDWILEMREVPFYGGALPIAVAAISYVLLLLPSTQRWIRS